VSSGGSSDGSTSGGGGDTALGPISLDGASPVSDHVPMGWMLIGIIGAFMLGSGLHELRTKALEGALLSSACPLET
jgi:hypothetical protein